MNDKITIAERGIKNGIYWREFVLPKDFVLPGYLFKLDYVIVMVKGSVEILTSDNQKITVNSPTVVEMKNDKRYEITALEDGTTYFQLFASTNDADCLPVLSQVDRIKFTESFKFDLGCCPE